MKARIESDRPCGDNTEASEYAEHLIERSVATIKRIKTGRFGLTPYGVESLREYEERRAFKINLAISIASLIIALIALLAEKSAK